MPEFTSSSSWRLKKERVFEATGSGSPNVRSGLSRGVTIETLIIVPLFSSTGSKYRDAFTEVILQLQASQRLEQIRHYWWRNYNISTPCSEKVIKSKDTSSLGLEQVGGCFVMILIGIGASVLISLQEFLYKVYHRATVTKRPFSEEVAREFRFSMARSSTRDFGAESALRLPPPPQPTQCLLPSKECRIAAMAYAPCLPAVVRSSPSPSSAAGAAMASTGHSRSNESRRPSALEVARMHRRASCRNPSSHLSSSSQQPLQVAPPAVINQCPLNPVTSNPAFTSESGRIFLQIDGRESPLEITAQRPATVSAQIVDHRRYPIAQPLNYAPRPPLPAPRIGFVTGPCGEPYPPSMAAQSGRSHGDIRMKKFTC